MRASTHVHERRSARGSGFTLIELVTTIALTGIVAGVIGMPLIWVSKTSLRHQQRATMLGQGRTALEQMARELREVSASGTSANISYASSTQVTFGSVILRGSGALLERSDDGGTSYQTLSSNVSSVTFAYADATGTALSSLPLGATDRANVRRVTITLALALGSETLTLRTSVFLRAFAYG